MESDKAEISSIFEQKLEKQSDFKSVINPNQTVQKID